MGIILMFLLSLGIKAQTPNTAVLTWDQQVGCITYDDDPQDMLAGEQYPPYTGINLSENILDGSCIRFCEKSRVTFSLNASNVAHVDWTISGGDLDTATNSQASVSWGEKGNGSITVTIVYNDNTVSTRTFCVEKIILPNSFFQVKGPNPNQTSFVVNSNINFKNLSTANGGTSLVSYVWDFGDGQLSTAFEPVHQYTAPGNYQVRLTVANSCNCTTVYYKTLSIDDPQPGCPRPILSCISMTCEGNIENYSVNDPSGGTWSVSGGTILGSNTAPNIDVRWDNIDPNTGMGYLTYQSNCHSSYYIYEQIPVIISRANILGPAVFCEGDQQLYTLPQWPTTEFEWALDGVSADDPSNKFLTHTANRNEILVGSLPAGTYQLTAKYRNTLLLADNCRGEAQFTITVNEKPVIQTNDPLVFCVAQTVNFNAASGNPVNWEIYLGSNLVHTDQAATTSFDFAEAGTYVVTAEINGCIGDPVLVEALSIPEITGTITGTQTVCLNVPYTYTINENDPAAIYSWSVSGGTIIGSNGGSQVDVFFTAPNGTVTVEKQYLRKGVICTSPSVSYSVTELVLNPAIVNNNGTSPFCPSSTYTFTADLNGVVPDHIAWELTPPNFGNIIAGVNSNTVTLTLNEVSNNNTAGVLTLTVTKCGVEEIRTINIYLNPKVNLTIGAIDAICPSDPIVVNVTMNTTVPNNPGTYWAFEYNGVQGTTEPYVSGATNYTFTIPQLFPTGTNAVAGVLAVKLVNPYGCTMKVAAYKSVTILPKTSVEIYQVAGGTRLCLPSSDTEPIKLKSTVSTGVTADGVYTWYHDDGIITSNLNYLSTNSELNFDSNNFPGEGNYYVQVTDINGCIITSNSINIFGCSGGGDPGNPGDGSHCNLGFSTTPTLTYNWISCDKVEVTASYSQPANIDHVNWSQSQPGITLETSPVPTNFKATYKITRAGIHNIHVTAYYDDCDHGFSRDIKVERNYEPILRYAVTCGANGNYTIALKNNTKLFDRSVNANNIEYFDISSGIPVSVGTGQTVTLNKTAGTYTYRMVLSGTTPTNISVCQPEVTIVIDNPPSTNVVTPAQNSTYCAEEPILVSIPGGYNNNYRYEWHFNGTQYVATAASSYINITDSGTHTITLKIINNHGCEFVSAPISVTINKAAFDGGIDPADPDFCETDALPLKYELSNPVSPSNPAPTSITWMRDDQVVHTGTTYLPTQSGSYWAVLTDANGCKDYSLVKSPVLYTLRKPPFASVNGNTNVCYGESTTLVGIYTDPTAQHRWTLNGNPIAGPLGNWVSGANNLDITHNGTTPGTYTYAFETRRSSGDTDCIGKFEAVVVVHPPVDPLFIDISFTCFLNPPVQRYITLTAMGGAPGGAYSWSNGKNTASITVFDGGVYTLTYTAPNGCTATSTVNIPKYPDNVLWVVPKGCYQICSSSNAYLLGPLGNYEWYQWFKNSAIYLQGSNIIPPIYVTQSGSYRLRIFQNGCWYYSDAPQITVLACRPGASSGTGSNSATETPTISAPNATVVNNTTSFMLLPNPAVDVATVQYDTGTQNATAVTVYNLNGAQVLQQQLNGTKGEVQLNVSQLAAGTYMVRLQAGNTVLAQQKLIKK
ncbi:PKD domain-containing protein [Myroides sp. JBRI-B21084]|uniref:T9SS type A sorting domain-containing protein n=1 Tax=Myroides sp. JBRI-B21084 TaxID=3119977 RepID=UPI0026E39A67|nr:PKD domain-containing protein [Paenimyroides cloacae]WKW46283.1 PKD domain-containing protein [Paenimyroides cloacae]